MKIYIILMCCFFFSCSKRDVAKFDMKLIEEIASEDLTLPSRYNMFDLYTKCDDNRISQINVQQLRVLYSKSDKSITFKKYLNLVLNQDQKTEESIDVKCFSLNSEIKKEYEESDIQDLIKKYFKKVNTSYRLKEAIDEDKRLTLFYYCFINNYLGTFNDYIGYYYIIKTDDLY